MSSATTSYVLSLCDRMEKSNIISLCQTRETTRFQETLCFRCLDSLNYCQLGDSTSTTTTTTNNNDNNNGDNSRPPCGHRRPGGSRSRGRFSASHAGRRRGQTLGNRRRRRRRHRSSRRRSSSYRESHGSVRRQQTDQPLTMVESMTVDGILGSDDQYRNIQVSNASVRGPRNNIMAPVPLRPDCMMVRTSTPSGLLQAVDHVRASTGAQHVGVLLLPQMPRRDEARREGDQPMTLSDLVYLIERVQGGHF
ncbi:hypothetical protein BGZ63DRAFT_459933 [Mariannaea sp. PMI_226]|nr:hypothetical protein BGZ63DRAFT_459933 [Mariannaea sp. PMI_226]